AALLEVGEVEAVGADPSFAHALPASDALGQVGDDVVDADPLLRARVAVADGDGLVRERLSVDGEAVRRPRLVHAGVALADGLLRVELGRAHPGADVAIELLGDRRHPLLVSEGEERRLTGM